MSESYIYLFTREDLSKQQQIIQTSHATHVMSYRVGMCNDRHDSIRANAVLIGAKSEEHLLEIKQYLDEKEIENEIFYEPDISAYTAIATYPLKGKDRIPLRKFNTM